MIVNKTSFFLAVLLLGMICRGQIKIADCVIYVAPGNPRSVTRAAQDLQKHIELATGNKLKIVFEARTPMIALGSSPEAGKAGVDASTMKYETHIMRTAGGNLYIAGRDIPGDRRAEKGGYSYGTLYGVYAFMNQVMGIAFLMPTDRGTYVPKLGKAWMIPAVDKTYTPQFEFRGFPYVPRARGACLEWKIRNFSDGLGDSGSVIPNHGHFWSTIYPTPGTLFTRSGNRDRAVTFKEHPEFFSADNNGNRIYPKFNFALCLSNEAVWKDVAERCVNHQKWARKYYKLDFKYDLISLSPNDGTYCRCKECQKRYVTITEKEVGAWKTAPKSNFSITDLILDYYRAATEQIAGKLENTEVTGLIYHHYMYAWKIKRKKMPPQFSAMMAPYHLSYGPGRAYSKINESWHKWLDDWDGMFERKYYYGLDFWFGQSAGAPWPVFAKMRQDTYPVLAKKGFNGVYLYGMDMLGVTAAHNWLQMQQAWDPMLDAEKAFDTFCTKAYGGGGKYVKEIYLLTEKNLTRFMAAIKGKMGYYLTPELMKDVYAGDWDEFSSLMEKAIEAPKDENQAWRLNHFVQNMRIFNYHLEKMGLIPENKSSKLYLSDAEYVAMTPLRSEGGKLEFFLPKPKRNSYAKSAQVPVKEVKAVSFKAPAGSAWFYLTADFLVQAVSDRITFQIEQKASVNPATGKPYLDGIPYFNVFSPDGKLYYSGIASQNRITFPAKKGETYFMWIYPQSDTTYGHKWRIIEADSPYAVGTRIHPSGLQIHTPADSRLYFFVPDGIKKFDLIAWAWGSFELLDPTGKVIVSNRRINGYKVIPVQDADGYLKQGVYELHVTSSLWGRIRFGKELPGYFVIDPDHALQVTLDEKKLQEHQKKFRF
ncbi:MAG: DUF4838 domain-containing protein [Lentisphaerae bacterium]|nr:DUF4838 domain-containing protein [Lentisphaerota bacterium]